MQLIRERDFWLTMRRNFIFILCSGCHHIFFLGNVFEVLNDLLSREIEKSLKRNILPNYKLFMAR